jgi:phage terminase small subunit
MPGGRPRKPRALKLVQGTDRPDRANAAAPAPRAAPLPRPPADLNAREQRAWAQLAELVDPLRVVTAADIVAFRQMAVCIAMIDQARSELKEHKWRTDYEVHTEFGTSYRKRPQVETIATYQKLLFAELGRFGLTPADREKVSAITEGSAGDPLDEFSAGDNGAA